MLGEVLVAFLLAGNAEEGWVYLGPPCEGIQTVTGLSDSGNFWLEPPLLLTSQQNRERIPSQLYTSRLLPSELLPPAGLCHTKALQSP